MAEISYPFNEDNANGGAKVVSQTQWQAMAKLWGPDRVDFQLTANTYGSTSLPFWATIVNGRTVQVNPGKAWVGGFYYSLTATQGVTVPNNSTTRPRKDLIVLQADMAKGAVNLVIVTGTPAASPVAPQPRRQAGGLWEMPLYEVDAAANNASVTIAGRMPFDSAPSVSVPWNAGNSAAFLPRGSFVVNMDNANGDAQTESFNGRDAYLVTRHLGKSKTYTPSVLNVSALPTNFRTGRWRWIAPNTFWFSARIDVDRNSGAWVSGSNWRSGITLPVASNKKAIQVLHGYMANPERSAGLPNMLSITATTEPGTSALLLHVPNVETATGGLDGLRGFPARSTFSISGVIESNQITE
ncbi:hypothetical protein ACQEVY_25375 [Streptomyces sp. CA-288835]|uniref:hypothetical protein n=1 Tax=Streptomyces sp. CA-288835 TaxID=3240069 RepID=UPI003D91B928